jgi:hypothetical protein
MAKVKNQVDSKMAARCIEFESKELYLLTVIVQLELGVSGDDGREEADRRFVTLPVRHYGSLLFLEQRTVSVDELQTFSEPGHQTPKKK